MVTSSFPVSPQILLCFFFSYLICCLKKKILIKSKLSIHDFYSCPLIRIQSHESAREAGKCSLHKERSYEVNLFIYISIYLFCVMYYLLQSLWIFWFFSINSVLVQIKILPRSWIPTLPMSISLEQMFYHWAFYYNICIVQLQHKSFHMFDSIMLQWVTYLCLCL